MIKRMLIAISLSFYGFAAHAEIIAATPQHYELRHEAVSDRTPDALWERLLEPADWWKSDHTYSGDAANLSLDARAGGLWREEWATGSVVHGVVLNRQDGKSLRLDAPFGPLQGMGVTVIWTIDIAREGEGSKITFTEIANGSTNSALDKLAPAVDTVKQEAIESLAHGN